MFAAWVCVLYLGVLYRGLVLDDVAYVFGGLRFSSLGYRRCILLLCMFIGLLVSGFMLGVSFPGIFGVGLICVWAGLLLVALVGCFVVYLIGFRDCGLLILLAYCSFRCLLASWFYCVYFSLCIVLGILLLWVILCGFGFVC